MEIARSKCNNLKDKNENNISNNRTTTGGE